MWEETGEPMVNLHGHRESANSTLTAGSKLGRWSCASTSRVTVLPIPKGTVSSVESVINGRRLILSETDGMQVSRTIRLRYMDRYSVQRGQRRAVSAGFTGQRAENVIYGQWYEWKGRRVVRSVDIVR